MSYEKLGNLYVANGDTPAALKAYQDALAIRKTLVALDPNIVQWRIDVAGSNGKLMLLNKDLNKKSEAIKYGEEALFILRELNKANKLDTDTKSWIAVTESYLAELRSQGK